MVSIYNTRTEAEAAREALPDTCGGFLATRSIRKTLDGKFAVIHIPASCWLSAETLARYNLPADTFGWLDEGEPIENGYELR